MLNKLELVFLEILKTSLKNETMQGHMELNEEEWQQLIRMAETHHVLPMFYESVFRLPSLQKLDAVVLGNLKKQVVHQVMLQTIKTEQFLHLNRQLQEAGVQPLVVKGLICRKLYPKPDCRQSGDEDVLIPAEQFMRCHEAMQSWGMMAADQELDIETAYEVPYAKKGSPLYIELHKNLFPPESEAYGDWNRYFEGVFERAVSENVQGSTVFTLEYTDHLFYLICHAFKHFLHSGFGLRQVCDIVLYANAYGSRIHWSKVLSKCREIHAEVFTAALFQIGEHYLTFDEEKACYPNEWRKIRVDETNMLHDLLSGGVYGGASMSRKHSSNITLDAVAAQKHGRRSKNKVLLSLFPSVKKMEGRYPYLKKHPYLLPAAWISRILKYHKETTKTEDNHAADAMRIGNQRIDLMKEYGILK